MDSAQRAAARRERKRISKARVRVQQRMAVQFPTMASVAGISPHQQEAEEINEGWLQMLTRQRLFADHLRFHLESLTHLQGGLTVHMGELDSEPLIQEVAPSPRSRGIGEGHCGGDATTTDTSWQLSDDIWDMLAVQIALRRGGTDFGSFPNICRAAHRASLRATVRNAMLFHDHWFLIAQCLLRSGGLQAAMGIRRCCHSAAVVVRQLTSPAWSHRYTTARDREKYVRGLLHGRAVEMTFSITGMS